MGPCYQFATQSKGRHLHCPQSALMGFHLHLPAAGGAGLPDRGTDPRRLLVYRGPTAQSTGAGFFLAHSLPSKKIFRFERNCARRYPPVPIDPICKDFGCTPPAPQLTITAPPGSWAKTTRRRKLLSRMSRQPGSFHPPSPVDGLSPVGFLGAFCLNSSILRAKAPTGP